MAMRGSITAPAAHGSINVIDTPELSTNDLVLSSNLGKNGVKILTGQQKISLDY